MVLILVGLLPTTANAGSVVNECKTGAECADLGFKYVTGKDVKQDDFKALKFFQKACDLNYTGVALILDFRMKKAKALNKMILRQSSFTKRRVI